VNRCDARRPWRRRSRKKARARLPPLGRFAPLPDPKPAGGRGPEVRSAANGDRVGTPASISRSADSGPPCEHRADGTPEGKKAKRQSGRRAWGALGDSKRVPRGHALGPRTVGSAVARFERLSLVTTSARERWGRPWHGSSGYRLWPPPRTAERVAGPQGSRWSPRTSASHTGHSWVRITPERGASRPLLTGGGPSVALSARWSLCLGMGGRNRRNM